MRSLPYVLSRRGPANPNYRHGTDALMRAGVNAAVDHWLPRLPKLLTRAPKHPTVEAMARELVDGHPSTWARLLARGRVHVPRRELTTARAWLSKIRRLRRLIGRLYALSRPIRFTAPNDSLTDTLKAIDHRSTPQRPARIDQIEALRRWAERQNVPWQPSAG